MSPFDHPDLKLRGLVHDLNNVFQTILDAADLIPEGSKWKRMATTIQNSAEHGIRLSRELLESREMAFEFSLIAESAIQFARDVLLVTSGPSIEFHSDIEGGLWLSGNPVGWERVLVNLFLNSAEAMKENGNVHLHARRADRGLLILVTDDGPGIPDEILPRIFEAHFSTKPTNSGLGLHIVRSIVESNGGTVSVRNRESRGAEFEIAVKMLS